MIILYVGNRPVNVLAGFVEAPIWQLSGSEAW